MRTRTKLMIVVLVVILVSAPVAWAVFNLVGNAPISVSLVPTPVTAAVITAMTLDNVQCTISGDGKSATCPVYAGQMFVGEAFPLSITVQNTGTIPAPVTVNPTSDNVVVATVAASSSNPTSIAASGSATFAFTITAKAQGTANIQVNING